ncbi:MAG: hypothetical protein SFV54_27405 [Bryobacteraceae bacterium]|nr:hypothetical protein [Bryobacteraceae bacterium]
MAGRLMQVYGLLIFAATADTAARSTRAELRESGMNLILAVLLVAFVGIALTFASGLEVPGWTVALPVLAIPLTMAVGVRRQARPEGTRGTARAASA